MDTKPNPKKSFGCFTVLVLSILAVSFFTTGSLNPLTVYTSGSIWVKIFVTALAVLSLPTFLKILFSLRVVMVWLILIAFYFIGSSALADPAQDIRIKAAYMVLDRIKTPNIENEEVWGITNFEIFADTRRFWINAPQKTDNDVVIPIWIRGTDSHGLSGQWKMKLHVTVEPTRTDSSVVFKVEDFSIDEMKLLSWWEQLGRWLFWSLIAPFAIMSLLFFTNGLTLLQTDSGCVNLAIILLLILGYLSLVGYFAYAFFGSIWAVVFGVLFWIMVTIFIVSIISSQ